MAARYATQAFACELSGQPILVENGAKFDSVTDSSLIALWSTNFTSTAPVAGTGNITGIMAGYLAAYPSGQVS